MFLFIFLCVIPGYLLYNVNEGDIHISVEDIELKSRDNTHVSSYRISVPAEDLVKAIDPTLWPLRVKVREYIYYKKKYLAPKQMSNANSGCRTGLHICRTMHC